MIYESIFTPISPPCNAFDEGAKHCMADMTKLDTMSVKQLEELFANTHPGSLHHDIIKPVLEAKRRHADSRRTWIIAGGTALIAIAGLVMRFFVK